MYYATIDNGAYCNGRKLKVSNEFKLKNCLVLLPSKIKNKKKIFNIFLP